MMLLSYIHSWLDWALGLCKLIQNREVGWLTVDRKTGREIRERQPLTKKLNLILLFNPVTEWIDRLQWYRRYMHHEAVKYGKEEESPTSKKKIREFVEFYGIDMNQFDPSDIDAYPTFQNFFIRKHREGTRPLHAPEDPSKATVVADCRLVVYPTVSESQKVWIKGRNFSISNLIGESSHPWADGAIASFRLSPQDYHRYHCPVEGTVKWWKKIDGTDYLVDPVAIRSDVDILTENERDCVCIDTKEFGQVLFVAIGATEVGKVKLSEHFKRTGQHVTKGEEVGIFEFGGSSIIVCFEKDRIDFDKDLIDLSRQKIEIDVEVGMSLGKATRPNA